MLSDLDRSHFDVYDLTATTRTAATEPPSTIRTCFRNVMNSICGDFAASSKMGSAWFALFAETFERVWLYHRASRGFRTIQAKLLLQLRNTLLEIGQHCPLLKNNSNQIFTRKILQRIEFRGYFGLH